MYVLLLSLLGVVAQVSALQTLPSLLLEAIMVVGFGALMLLSSGAVVEGSGTKGAGYWLWNIGYRV